MADWAYYQFGKGIKGIGPPLKKKLPSENPLTA